MSSFAFWVATLLCLLWQLAGQSALLFPPPLALSNRELSRYPLNLDFRSFRERLYKRHTAHATVQESLSLLQSLEGSLLQSPLGSSLLRTHTPYLHMTLNSTSVMRRAPAVGRSGGRGWLLTSANLGEDIYGRPLDLVTNTFLFAPEQTPKPWPATSLCARLLRSGDIKQKDWWLDLSRAVGGRLRPFALAVVAQSECEPEYGLLALVGVTAGSLLAASLTVRLFI